MDDLRGFGSHDSFQSDDADYVSYEDVGLDDEDVGLDAPPLVSGDERRMQVRAYNFWTSLLGERNFPDIEDLEPASVPEFADNGVLLDFTSGIENPSIQFLGSAIRDECQIEGNIFYLDQVPALAAERDAQWARVSGAEFLTDAEKRALLGLPVLAEPGDV